MGKNKNDLFFKKMEESIAYLNDDDQKKMDFARQFLNKLQISDIEDGRIQIAELDVKTLQFFIFSIVLEYSMYHKL
jgi:hypothetical protein